VNTSNEFGLEKGGPVSNHIYQMQSRDGALISCYLLL